MSQAPRRSSRLKSHKLPTAVFAELDPVDDNEQEFLVLENHEEADEDEPFQARKRKKSTTERGDLAKQKRRGKLARLPDMPLDILYEIFRHLNPLDILHLAWTTRPIRGVLLSRSSRFIWKEALVAIDGTPPCPPDMTEPQYTRLIFYHFCHFCQAPSVANVLWTLRVRACKRCVNEHFIYLPEVEYMLPPPLRSIVKSSGFHLGQLVNHSFLNGKRRSDYYCPRFLKSQVHKFTDDAMLLINDEEKLVAFLKERKAATSAISQHAHECEEWYNTKRHVRREELQFVRRARRTAIYQKLVDLGWESELQHIKEYAPHAFNNHSLVKQPRELTDRIWAKVEPQLIQWLETKKEQRLEDERVQLMISCLSTLKEGYHAYYIQHTGEVLPTISDVFDMSDVRDIVNQDGTNLTRKTFAPVIAKLPELVEHWRLENLKKLAQLVPETARNIQSEGEEGCLNTMSVLDFATCWFKCERCIEPLSYDRLFHHRCLTSLVLLSQEELFPEKRIFQNLGCIPHHYRRPFCGTEYSELFAQWAATFIRMNGLDPDHATIKDMDDEGARFACQHCNQTGYRNIMTWRVAIAHQHRDHGKDCFRWKKLNAFETSEARKIEKQTEDISIIIWKCALCVDQVASSLVWARTRLIDHLKANHKITDAEMGKHYFKDPDLLASYGGVPVTTV